VILLRPLTLYGLGSRPLRSKAMRILRSARQRQVRSLLRCWPEYTPQFTDPQCSGCGGTGVCQVCQGTGRAQGISTEDRRYLAPVWLRFVGSIFLLILFAAVVKGAPVHWGRGGTVMPRWLGVLYVSSACAVGLRFI